MIDISIEPLENTITVIRQMNENLKEVLSELKAHMCSLEGSWIGAVSNTFLGKVQLLDRNFELYHQIIERYASHLEAVIEQYRLTEYNLQRNILEF